MDTPEAIIEAIRAAFAGVPRGAITLHEAEVIDDYGSTEERQEARRLDSEASWEEVPDEALESCTSALCHLDPKSWRYYIPAYMIWSLRHFRESESIVSDFTIYTFNPYLDDPGLREYVAPRFRLLDGPQSRAVCRYLRYMAANEDHADTRMANLALEGYWQRFCEAGHGP